jgi:hypothetical protein
MAWWNSRIICWELGFEEKEYFVKKNRSANMADAIT